MRIREAVTDDADAVSAVFLASRAAAMPWLPVLHTDAETRWWVEHVVLAGCATWVAVAGDVVGFAALRGDVLEHLYLRPEIQRQGIGTALLACVRRARPDGLTLHVFERNTAARAFYAAHGFHVVGGGGSGNEEHEPDVVYAWEP